MFEYLIEIESITYDENGAPLFADKVYHTIKASNDKEACRTARANFCLSIVNPYGQKTICELRAVYRRGLLY